mgnify:FL=1
MNEDDLVNSCTGTCDDLPTVNNKNGCKRIHSCKKNTEGWTRGTVRCDYCSCKCEKIGNPRDFTEKDEARTFTEPDLYGTCTGTCPKKGLVRTNWKGCSSVKNCGLDATGWTRGFVRCDYCSCTCTTKVYADRYSLENVVYDLSESATQENKDTLIGMAETIVANRGSHKQKTTRTLSFEVTSETTVTTSSSVEHGLEVTVSAGINLGEIAQLSTAVTTSIKTGFTYEQGKTLSKKQTDSITAEVEVPPHSSVKVSIVGHRMEINVPYKADLVTTYKDGSTSRKQTTGTMTNVSVGKFRVQYGNATPLKD